MTVPNASDVWGDGPSPGRVGRTGWATLGLFIPVVSWLALVPWDLSSVHAQDGTVARMAFVIALTSVGCGVSAFSDRTAGRRFTLVASLASLLLFVRAAVADEDPLWPFAALLFLLIMMGATGVAFAFGRWLRCGSVME